MKTKYAALVVALATALAMAIPAAGADQPDRLADVSPSRTVVEGKYNSYIVVLKADPLVVTEGKDNLNTARARDNGNKLRSSHDAVLKEAGISTADKVNDYVNALNGFSALITYEEALKIAANNKVAAVFPDELKQPTTENTPDFLGLTSKRGAWATGYTGEGVVIGVIDSGIWPEHASFADDGSYSSLGISLDESERSACDFGNTAHNPNDAPFSCNDKLLGARQMMDTYRALIGADPDEFDSARDDDGHGTHTASTAGGNSGVLATIFGVDRGVVSGIAPRARIVAYKGLGNLGGFGSDLAAAIDQSVADGVDVINYSVGGGPSLLGADDIAYLFAADAGVFVATSASNNGPGPDTIGGPASVPWLTSVGASTHDRTFLGTASSSDGGWSFDGESITAGTNGELPLVDAADVGDELCPAGSLDPAQVAGKIVLCKRGVYDRIEKSLAVYQAGGAGMILYNATDTQSQVTDNHWVPTVHITNTEGLVVKDYIANASAPVAELFGGVATPTQGSVMADFSSRGPNGVAADIIKPDVTAPGVNVLAGASPFPDPGSVPGELFQSISGTSMSSPHVAGLFALLKQAHPDWSPAAAKSALMTTSRQNVFKEDGVTRADPFDMGAGHVVPGSPVKAGSAFQPGLVYDAGFNEYLGFLCDAAPEAFGDPDATCGLLDSLGIPTDASDLNLASIGVAELAGSQTITRTVTSVAATGGPVTYRANVKAPRGYDVEVSPSQFTIRRGESVTYTVTITNESAPIGAWRFGSLTWKSSKYKVYSPIAVNAALFDSIDAFAGTGEEGSGAFDVSFGYTGVYSAAGHGLVAADVTNDNVVQDPDQNFDPNDGFSNAHTFDLSGAAYFRVAMPEDAVPSPDTDIDIYLYDPSGTQVASSTSGGTNEEIEIFLPADGTWTLYVHGWQTAPGPDSDYTLYEWDISATPGGSLVVDSAPTSATLGESGTIEFSWSGATTGSWYLGAISHTGDAGLLGLTLVEIDNR